MKVKVVFQANDIQLTIDDFIDSDIPIVEQYFFNPYYGDNTFPRKDFYEYLEYVKHSKSKCGYLKTCNYMPAMEIFVC